MDSEMFDNEVQVFFSALHYHSTLLRLVIVVIQDRLTTVSNRSFHVQSRFGCFGNQNNEASDNSRN
jgi:hypothetical protein